MPYPALASYKLAAMDQSKRALERAFQLAELGVSITDIRKRLRSEGYDEKQLTGRAMEKQLRKIIDTRRGRTRGPSTARSDD